MIEPSQVKLVANLILMNQLLAQIFATSYANQGVTLDDFDTRIRPQAMHQSQHQTFVGVIPEIGDLLASEYQEALATQMGLQRGLLETALATAAPAASEPPATLDAAGSRSSATINRTSTYASGAWLPRNAGCASARTWIHPSPSGSVAIQPTLMVRPYNIVTFLDAAERATISKAIAIYAAEY